MKKASITLVRRGGTDSYRVEKTVDTLTVKAGDCLSEKEVSELVNSPKYKVTIKCSHIR